MIESVYQHDHNCRERHHRRAIALDKLMLSIQGCGASEAIVSLTVCGWPQEHERRLTPRRVPPARRHTISTNLRKATLNKKHRCWGRHHAVVSQFFANP